ncbi:hypothetical protein F4678DRAFT_439848 [Xylaria arbuscula]|nr:hypothetical protein F4678DRAFT_439848 [Xylaria arbuscula]
MVSSECWGPRLPDCMIVHVCRFLIICRAAAQPISMISIEFGGDCIIYCAEGFPVEWINYCRLTYLLYVAVALR